MVSASAPAPLRMVRLPASSYVAVFVTPPGAVRVAGRPFASYAVVKVRSAGFGWAWVAGSIFDSGRFHVLYVVRNELPRPSVNRVRFPAAS